MSSCPVLHFYHVSLKFQRVFVTEQTRNQCIIILVCNTSSFPVLLFYQVPSKYSKGYKSYRADTKSISNKTEDNNYKSKKARVVILVPDTSSCPVLYFYHQNIPKGIQVSEWTRSFTLMPRMGSVPKTVCAHTLE